jgi:hypothetical protein
MRPMPSRTHSLNTPHFGELPARPVSMLSCCEHAAPSSRCNSWCCFSIHRACGLDCCQKDFARRAELPNHVVIACAIVNRPCTIPVARVGDTPGNTIGVFPNVGCYLIVAVRVIKLHAINQQTRSTLHLPPRSHALNTPHSRRAASLRWWCLANPC